MGYISMWFTIPEVRRCRLRPVSKPVLKLESAYGISAKKCLKLKYDEVLSDFAFKSNLRRHSEGKDAAVFSMSGNRTAQSEMAGRC